MYTLIGSPFTRTLRVLWALEEIGVDYELVAASPASERARSHNPSGKIPVLIVDGREVIDSVAIVQFLADRHGALTYPAGSVERALQDSFTQFTVDEVDGNLWTAAKHSFALPEALRVPDIKATARAEFARAMGNLERRLGDGPYVMGEKFTVPDLLLGHCARWADKAGFDIPDGKLTPYLKRVLDRPALARAIQRAAQETAPAPV